MKQSRGVPLVRSFVVLGIFSAGLSQTTAAQGPQKEDPASSSSLVSALLAPMLPDAPGAASATTSSAEQGTAKHHIETSVSIGGFPQLTATRILNPSAGGFSTQSLHPSPGALIAFRQSFRPWLGYSVNMGYTRASEHITTNAGVFTAGGAGNFYVPNNVYELSLTHVAQTHLTHRLTGFTEAGAGFMTFQPAQKGSFVQTPAGVATTSFRPLIVFGAGADYHFNAQWALRGEYRGLLYKFPNYGLDGVNRLITISSEPTVSLTYTFGAKKHVFKQ